MDFFIRFLFDFLSQFFNGVIIIFKNLGLGLYEILNFPAYADIVKAYSGDIDGVGGWILVGVVILVFLLILVLIGFAIYMVLRKYLRFRKTLVDQESLLDEVADLNRSVFQLTQEKQKILSMKVSQLGLKPGESSEEDFDVDDEEKDAKDSGSIGRFFKLSTVDNELAKYKNEDFHNTFTLEELCDTFRNFAASKMKLYYKVDIIRLFVASLGATKLVVLQGISGTGKTSLPYAWGKFLKNDAIIASVQPSWRDKTELFGYFNEFTKKFNETEVLMKMYEAGYKDQVYLTILDEMNIARVEYYFAEMLSILEMPSRDEWIIDLVPDVWKDDPKHISGGKLTIPPNMWYIGTINNDDSTFMVTDKVYDRAMPIDINDKGEAFEAEVTDPMPINFTYLESLFDKAKIDNPVSDELMSKLEEMDNYVIEHFRLAFGNRIVKHVREFIPVYVACGGTEIDGLDYIVAKKILRKFEQLNLSFIRDELDAFVKFLNKLYGKDNMNECKEYLKRLKKLM